MSYFEAKDRVLGAVSELYTLVGENITGRDGIYHRGAFYGDAADVIEALVEMGAAPFSQSSDQWLWLAAEFDKRSVELGEDKKFALALPPAQVVDDPHDYGDVTNSLDKMVNLMTTYYLAESGDRDKDGNDEITKAECVKIVWTFVQFWLAKRCGTYERGYIKPWPWVAEVAKELKAVYLQMGEGTPWQRLVAGVNPPAGGEVPPISWPGSK